MSPTLTSPTAAADAPAGSDITAGQQAFIAAIQAKVQQVISSQLGGNTFTPVSYPNGIHIEFQIGQSANYNILSLNDFDQTLATDATTGAVSMTSPAFSALYADILSNATYKFSAADQTIIDNDNEAAQSEITGVIDAFTEAGYTFPSPLPAATPSDLSYVYNFVQTQLGGEAGLSGNPVLADLLSAMEAYDQATSASQELQGKFNAATARLTAAINNITTPSATNGGLLVVDEKNNQSYVAAYALPNSAAIIDSWNTLTNAVNVTIDVASSSSSSTQVSFDGSAALELPIADIIDISASGNAHYDSSDFVSESSSLSIGISYQGVTPMNVTPMNLSVDNKKGWYDEEILTQLAENTPDSSGHYNTGYAMASVTAYPVGEYLGPNGKLSRLKTFVISQVPTTSFTFSGSSSASASKDFGANVSAEVDILGIFSIGSANGSYSSGSGATANADGSVTATFAPPSQAGVPTADTTAYLMGGVTSYPPAS